VNPTVVLPQQVLPDEQHIARLPVPQAN